MTDEETAEPVVLRERTDEGVLVATLNRPRRLNALNAEMFAELERLARDVRADRDVRAVVLTGAGRAFCSGFDLDDALELSRTSATGMLDLQELAAAAFRGIREARVPVIAAVNGPAAGGGFSLALQADIRLAGPDASFLASYTTIGMSGGDLGASWLLPRLVGPGNAAEIAFTGRRVDAEEAASMRLVNRVVTDGPVADAALELARSIARNSPAGVRLSKSALNANLEVPSYAAALELENRGQTLLTRTEDMGEALAAFLEKRPARFGNR